jgi:hypothetical protein
MPNTKYKGSHMRKAVTLLLIGLVASFAVIAASPAGAKKGHPRAHAKTLKRLLHGIVQSVGSDSVTLTRKKGDPVTVQVNGNTRVVVNGKAGSLADIQVGYRAVARVPRGGGAAKVLRAAAAPVPGTLVHGRVDSVGAGSITLKLKNDSMVTIPVNAGTKIKVNGKAASLDLVEAGYHAIVRRTAANGPAAAINAYQPRSQGLLVRGLVDSVGSSSITLKGRGDGPTITIGVTAQTIIRVGGKPGALSNIQTGYRALVLLAGAGGDALAIIAFPPRG